MTTHPLGKHIENRFGMTGNSMSLVGTKQNSAKSFGIFLLNCDMHMSNLHTINVNNMHFLIYNMFYTLSSKTCVFNFQKYHLVAKFSKSPNCEI